MATILSVMSKTGEQFLEHVASSLWAYTAQYQQILVQTDLQIG